MRNTKSKKNNNTILVSFWSGAYARRETAHCNSRVPRPSEKDIVCKVPLVVTRRFEGKPRSRSVSFLTSPNTGKLNLDPTYVRELVSVYKRLAHGSIGYVPQHVSKKPAILSANNKHGVYRIFVFSLTRWKELYCNLERARSLGKQISRTGRTSTELARMRKPGIEMEKPLQLFVWAVTYSRVVRNSVSFLPVFFLRGRCQG